MKCKNGNTNIVPNLMLADSLDYKEWKTGLRMEGSANAVMGLTNKVTGALSTALMNYGLAFFRFISPVTDELTGRAIEQVQSAATLTGMHMMFTIIPAAFGLLSIIPILFYDFEGSKKEKILAEQRAEARSGGRRISDPHGKHVNRGSTEKLYDRLRRRRAAPRGCADGAAVFFRRAATFSLSELYIRQSGTKSGSR